MNIDAFSSQFASYIKFHTKDKKIDLSQEIINYINGEDISSNTDKYFNNYNTLLDYDKLFYDFIINSKEKISYKMFEELDREKIIEYSLILLAQNQF
jgi:hypothetical protein